MERSKGAHFCLSFFSHRSIHSLHSAVIFSLLTFSWALHAKTGPHDSLENLGFTLLQGTPIDFELPRLEGGKQSVRNLRGKWIWLVFWATWCGPCTEELPALEKLYQEYKNKNFSVLAVSVDKARAAVENFAREKSLSLPILLDSLGTASGKYRASALPTIYVISPDWKLAGILRGAKDWASSETRTSLNSLLQHREYQDTDGIKMVEEDGGLSLPNNLAPPELSVHLDGQHFKKGESLPLTVMVSWKGSSKDYLIKVPKITLSDGITQSDVSSSSSSENENTTLRYHFRLISEKEGNHKIGPIELAYSPRVGGKELFSRNDGLSVEVDKENLTRILVPIGCLIALLIGGTFVFVRKRYRSQVSVSTLNRDWNEPFEEIRQMKMRGEKQKYMAALLKLNLQIDKERGEKNPIAAALLEKVQFGSHALSEAELSSFEKRIEKVIKESP